MLERLKLLALFVFIHIAQIPLSLVWLWACFFDTKRAWDTSLAYDRMANAETNGNPWETISSRAGYALASENPGKGWCILCKFLDWFEKDHCLKSRGW